MRVLWIHQNYVSADEAGNSRATFLINQLVEGKVDVTVVRSQHNYLGQHKYRSNEIIIERPNEYLAIHHLPANNHKADPANRSRSYLSFIKRSIRHAWTLPKPDIVFASSPPLPQLIPALILAWWHRCPLVLEIRDLWPYFLVDCGLLKDGIVAKLMYFLEAFAYRFADRVISVSPAFNEYLLAMGIPDDLLLTVPTGADPRWQRCNAEIGSEWRERNQVHNKFLVVYAGSFNKPYNIPLLLDAAALMETDRPDVVWVFAGAGLHVEEVAAAARRGGNIMYLGALKKDELIPLLSAADLGLISLQAHKSFQTVIPGKLFDYLGAGVPVLSLIAGQAQWIVESAQAGWSCANPTSNDLAETVRKITLMEKEERSQKGINGREWVYRNSNAYDMADNIRRALIDTQQNYRAPALRLLSPLTHALGAVIKRRSQASFNRTFENGMLRKRRDKFQL